MPSFSRFLVWRLAQFVAAVLCASFLIFLIIQLTPGNLAEIHALAPATVSRLHLDEPAWRQYFLWLWGCLRGDFGIALTNGLPVGSLLVDYAPVTAGLAAGSLAISLLIAVPLAVAAGTNPESQRVQWLVTAAYGLSATPVFVVGYVVLAVIFGGFKFYPLDPPLPDASLWAVAAYYLLPMLVLALGNGTVGEFVRVLSLEIRGVDGSLFVRAARARGAPLLRHFLRPALLPFVSVVISRLAVLLGGAVVVERIFNRHGLGWLTWEATLDRDFFVVMAVTLVSAFFIRMLLFLQDLLAWQLDPRLRK